MPRARPPPPPGPRAAAASGPDRPPPSSEFLINSTISRDWSLKSVENSLQSFVPNEQDFSQPTQIIQLEPKSMAAVGLADIGAETLPQCRRNLRTALPQ